MCVPKEDSTPVNLRRVQKEKIILRERGIRRVTKDELILLTKGAGREDNSKVRNTRIIKKIRADFYLRSVQ